MSMLSHFFSVIVECGIGAPLHSRKVVDEPNSIYKRFLFQLMSNVQLSGENIYDTQIFMHTGTCTYYASLNSEFQRHLYAAAGKHGVIDQGK